MKINWKMVGIIALFLGVILLIWWAVKSARTGKDVKTGVSNDKIQAAAESVGVPKPIAEQIAQAPDSEAAARRIGINPVIATAIANGVDMRTGDKPCPPNTHYDNGKCIRNTTSGTATTTRYAELIPSEILLPVTEVGRFYIPDKNGNIMPCPSGYSSCGYDEVKGNCCEKTPPPTK